MSYLNMNDVNIDELSIESIDVQKDVAIVNTLQGYFGEIVDIIRDKEIEEGRAMRVRAIRVLFARIDVAVHDRFGYNNKTVESISNTISVQTTPPGNYNVLAGRVNDNYKTIESMLRDHKRAALDKDDIDARTTNWVKILQTYLQSVDSVDRQLESSSITVDLARAKIIGYPDKALAVTLINPVKLVIEYGMSAEQLTATYLHECGHVFTHLLYSYRTISQVNGMIESILTEVGKNKTPLEAIKLSYYKVYNDNEIQDSTTVASAAVGVTSKHLKDLKLLGGSTYGSKESERLADNFVVRFGEGAALGEALKKMNAYNDNYTSTLLRDTGLVMLAMYAVSTLVAIFLPALGLGLAMGTIMVTGVLVAYVLLGFAMWALFTLIAALFSRGVDATYPYDNPKRRILKIKNEMVRQLRTMDMSKEAEIALLASIDALISMSTNLSDEDEGLIYRMVGSLFSYSGEQNQIRDMDNAVDDLMNNELHAAAARMKHI